MKYVPEIPENKKPIVSIGAGGIVSDSHYPAYKLAGFDVIGIYDLNVDRAAEMAEKFGVPKVCPTLDESIELAKEKDAIFDVAVPASVISGGAISGDLMDPEFPAYLDQFQNDSLKGI